MPRADRRYAVPALAALAFVLTPALAQAATCPSTATIQGSSGTGSVIDFDQHHPDGAPLRGNVLHQETNYVRGHFYELNGVSITLRDGLNTYHLSPGSIIALQCYGQAKGSSVLYPAVDMLTGRATVDVSASDPGGVLTNEGLYGPIPGQSISHGYTFQAARTPRGQVGHMGLLNWFAGYANQPTGTTTIAVQGASLVNVTPYVGPGQGHCRHVRKAILTSTGTRKVAGNSYVPTGSARYFG